ncbi:MAG: tetratricopeptide (TPR) repeat protein, partial [Dokdonia sp.]
MKQLFFLGIIGICIGGSYSPFAKAHTYQTIRLPVYEQQSITEAIYLKLDAFIEAPQLSNGQAFYQWLKDQSISTKEEQLAQVISLSNLGFFASAHGDNQRAIQYYAEGWNIYNSNQLSGFDILQSCLKPLGNLYTQTNALSEAQQIIEIYILRAQEAKRIEIIPGGIANLSVVYQNQGNYEKAISLIEEGLKRHPRYPNLLTNLATNLFAVDRHQEGLKVAQQSLAINPNQPNIYKMRAQLYAGKKRYTEAVQELKQAYLLQQENPRTPQRGLAKTQLALAEIYVQLNQLETAKIALKNVYTRVLQNSVPPFDSEQDVPALRQLFPENTLMDALDLDAHIAFLENDSPGSLKRYELAAYTAALLNTRQRNQQSRLIMQSNSKKRIETYLTIAHASYLKEKDLKILENAFLMFQKATASIVSETYINKKQRQPYRDDALSIDLEQREKKQANWNVEAYENQRLGIPNPLEYAAILDSIDQNGYQINTLQNQLRLKYPALNERYETSVSEVQSKARKKGQTVVSYFMGTTASYQFVISGSEVTFNRLTSGAKAQEDFKQECVQFISYFKDAGQINNDPNGYTQAAYLLFKKLNLPDADALIIIPDSFLQFIPFDALLTEESKGFQYGKMPFLLRQSRLSYALSPLLYLEEDIPMVKHPMALGVFPVFEGTPLELTHSIEE